MIADIAVILIMLLCVFLGYKKGLIKVAVRIISFVLALVIALVLYTPVSNYIVENTEIVPNLKNTIYEKLYHNSDKVNEAEVDTSITSTIENYVNKYTEDIKSNTSEYISEQLAIIVVRILTWIGLFIVSRVVLVVIRIFTDAIGEIPIIKQFNKVRWYNIWYFRRTCYNLCISCYI